MTRDIRKKKYIMINGAIVDAVKDGELYSHGVDQDRATNVRNGNLNS